jgi:hypothetical protein
MPNCLRCQARLSGLKGVVSSLLVASAVIGASAQAGPEVREPARARSCANDLAYQPSKRPHQIPQSSLANPLGTP